MNKEKKIKKLRKARRIVRTRNKILGNKSKPRLSVFRSNKYIYAQLIDDKSGTTIVSASEKDIKGADFGRIQMAEEVGKALAQKAKAKKVKNAVFDKGSYRYHGRIKALAEGARKEGLVF